MLLEVHPGQLLPFSALPRPVQSQATLDSCCRLTRHNPNSEKTPPPRPVSVHLFFTAVGRVCARGMRGELVSVRVLQRLAEKRGEIVPTARGKALSLSIAADRTLGSTVSFRTMKRYARRSSSLAKRKVSAKITRVQGEELACDSLAGVEVLEREVTRKRSDHLNLGATVPSASVGHSSGEMYTGQEPSQGRTTYKSELLAKGQEASARLSSSFQLPRDDELDLKTHREVATTTRRVLDSIATETPGYLLRHPAHRRTPRPLRFPPSARTRSRAHSGRLRRLETISEPCLSGNLS